MEVNDIMLTMSNKMHGDATMDTSGNVTVSGSGGVSDHALLTHLDYASSGHTGFQSSLGFTAVPNTRTVNSKALSSNITLATSDISDSTDKRYVTDAQLVVINSGTSQYSINSGTAAFATNSGTSLSCSGTSVFSTTSGTCSGNSATATTSTACSGTAVFATTSGTCSGNSATTTKLFTARTIGGNSFDGTANINVGTSLSCSGTSVFATTSGTCSGNAATATTASACSGTSVFATTSGTSTVSLSCSGTSVFATTSGTALAFSGTSVACSGTSVYAISAGTANTVAGRDATCVATKATNTQTIATGGYVLILLDTASIDAKSWFNTTTHRHVPQLAGKWKYTFDARISSGVTNATYVWAIFKGGADAAEHNNQMAQNYWADAVSTIIDMNGSSDYVEAYCYITSGGSPTVDAPKLMCEYIGT